MNPGIKYALENGGDYIFLLNNDVIVSQPDFIIKMVQFMEEHSQIGIVGPKLLFNDGSYQKSYNKYILAMALEPWWPAKMTLLLRRLGLSHSKGNDTFKVGWVNAVALLFKRQVFEDIGLMDERFFLGAEDIDLSLRAKRKGWETWYYPKAELIHLSFISHAKSTIAYDKYYAVSTVKFLYKHYSWVVASTLRLLTALGFFLRGIEWLIVSIIKKSKFKTAKELFQMSKLIFTISSK
ncbi:MAG: N-acetylglucosaminyl-diphospho-decaprenol L-rhamnosyltransferase [Syntrophomonadaceae bacterium]|nr:N-acetylglucosaminyl-diphospho-decaprenol L-rhamnosyltransferase [Bacillota bacterium]